MCLLWHFDRMEMAHVFNNYVLPHIRSSLYFQNLNWDTGESEACLWACLLSSRQPSEVGMEQNICSLNAGRLRDPGSPPWG